MKLYITTSVIIIILIFSFLIISLFENLIGYLITGACALALTAFVVSLLYARRDMKEVLSENLNSYSIIALCLIILFFLLFSIFALPKTELIFFDENIYQGIALNILHSGNALMCWNGTPYVQKCFSTELGFDPGGWPFLISIAFGIFGISNTTSYNLELFLGVLSIISVFLIANLLIKRKELGPISAVIFSFIPEVFIWSKTLANPDMSFMAFAILAMLLFLIFIKRSNKKTLLPFIFCILFAIYLRVEALLLVPFFLVIFLTLGDLGIRKTFNTKIKLLFVKLSSDRNLLFLGMVSIILIEPQLYTMIATTPELQANAAFYLYPNTPIFSSSYVLPNLSANVLFLAGLLKDYPIIFLPNITAFAILGLIFLLFMKKYKSRFAVLLLLFGFFSVYFIFYLFYFSGSVLVGVSVRYFLILYPVLSILAAFGLLGLGDLIIGVFSKGRNQRYLTYSILVFLFFALPFIYTAPILINPTYTYYGFPVNNITANIPGLNPYTTQYAKTSEDFIRSNYKLVPAGCLVLSEVPSLWFMLNRSSSALSETDIFTNASYRNYSCYYLSYDFWCTVSPYNTTVCKFYTTNYKLKLLATESSGGASNFSLYQILNYTKK
ncbi:glycosyltransferase family 39 protein [Candidatus Marsarchaeota archaeon]|nr:glycosyltransferase family 39 protein [Candidatus Marsarchaeota archaeon]